MNKQAAQQQAARLKPFHESVVEAIHRASTEEQLRCLGELIKETEITENHDEILAAWDARTCWLVRYGGFWFGPYSNKQEGYEHMRNDVRASLVTQKREAEKTPPPYQPKEMVYPPDTVETG